ncbi:universal stress protein [Nannocystaceae bacterium ST9]
MSASFDVTLGLDLRPQTTGAVQFGLWLCRTAKVAEAQHMHAVHVIEPDVLLELLRHADEETLLGAFAQRGKQLLDQVAHGTHLPPPEVFAGDAVELLEKRTRAHGSSALLISRKAPGDRSLSLPRLGAVARKLLRRLEVPVIVTPADLLVSQIGEGPIVVAVDFTEGSYRAYTWARFLALDLGRPLLLVHLADMPDQLGYGGFVATSRWEELSNEVLDRGRERMDQFMKGHGIEHAQTNVARGPVLPGLIDLATTAKACMLVCGSGHHGLLHRIVVPSVASESASMAPMAVAVVP